MFPLLFPTEHTAGIQKLLIDRLKWGNSHPPTGIPSSSILLRREQAFLPEEPLLMLPDPASHANSPAAAPVTEKFGALHVKPGSMVPLWRWASCRPRRTAPPTVGGFFLTQRYILNGSQYYPTTLFPWSLRKSVDILRVISEEEP